MVISKLEEIVFRRVSRTEKYVARMVINSTEAAEYFIKQWKKEHRGTRKQALARLEDLGVSLKRLERKEKRMAALERREAKAANKKILSF